MISRRTLMALFGGAVVAPLLPKAAVGIPIQVTANVVTHGADMELYAWGWNDLPNCRCVLLPSLEIFE